MSNAKSEQDQSKEKLLKVKGQVEAVKSAMHDNISMALNNTIKMEELSIKAENLSNDSKVFNDGAKKLKNQIWWKNVKMYIAIASVVAIILTIVISVAVLSAQNDNDSRRLVQEIGNNFIDFSFEIFDPKVFLGDVETHGNLRTGISGVGFRY
jgi:vesicle-associated membrane protein 4